MEKNRGSKRGLIIIFILLLIPIASALSFTGFFKDIGNLITGYQASSTILATNMSFTGNYPPNLTRVSIIGVQSITEDGRTNIYFSFLANDTDGRANLDDSTAIANFSMPGEDTRSNSSCITESDTGDGQANYSCTIALWYWDAAGNWTITTYLKDLTGDAGLNNSLNFSLGETTGVKMVPAVLTWPTMTIGSSNTLSSNFITINNTCNDDITTGNVRIEGINLTGEENSAYFITAANFSGNVTQDCEGTKLVEDTATGILTSILTAGNHSELDNVTGQETIFFCAETIPGNIITQAYSTNKSGTPWTIDVV